jgi:transcriptional regulator with XRE-family HTH domain
MDTMWIRQQLAIAGKTQAQLAEAFGMSSVQVNKILTGYRRLKAEEADSIRRFFGYELPEERPSAIAVVGTVQESDLLTVANGDGSCLYSIRRPSWVPSGNIQAAEITGSSAEPWALRGDIVFWSSPVSGVSEDDLGRPVIAQTKDGRLLLKRLASSHVPGRWSLLSLNPTHPNLMDVELDWAARVISPLASDQVVVVAHEAA